MNKYKLFYLFWLIPAAFLFLLLHQVGVYYGLTDTYENGTSYTAEVTEFEFKQIAAQANGYVVLRFETNEGEEIQRQLSLPVEIAGDLQDIRVIPIRYQRGAFQEIVLMPAYESHKNLVWSNILMAAVALFITFFVGFAAHRFANKKLNEDEEELVIERID